MKKHNSSKISALLSGGFGILVVAIAIVNLLWGNDPGFGIFLLLLSFIFFPVVTDLMLKKTGFTIHWVVKVILGLLILWASLGVGELPDKIRRMQKACFAQYLMVDLKNTYSSFL